MRKISSFIRACALLLAFGLSLVFAAGASAVESGRTLRVVALEAPPLCMQGPDGKAEGLLVDIVREALRRAGYGAEFEILPWKRCLETTRGGEADAVFYAGYSQERAKYLYYPMEQLFEEQTVFWRRAGSPARLARDYSNARRFTIAAGIGYHYGGRLDRALAEGLFRHVERISGWERGVWMLLNGRVDFFLADRLPALHLLRERGLTDRIEPLRDAGGEIMIWSRSPAYLCFSRASTTREDVRAFDAALSVLKQDGTYESLLSASR